MKAKQEKNMLNILFHKSTEITTEIKQFLMLLDNVRKKDQLTASSVLKNRQMIQSQVYSMYDVPLILPCCQGSFLRILTPSTKPAF